MMSLTVDDFKEVCDKYGGTYSVLGDKVVACEIDGVSIGLQTKHPENMKMNIKSKNQKVSIHINDPNLELLSGKLRITDTYW
jgi:hypothetical protein